MRKEKRKREKREKKKKNENKERGDEVSITKTKTKSQLAREAREEIPSILVKKALYPLVPSKNDKEQYFAHFLDIFNKMERTIPFREALQQMPLYTKFLKDFLTKKEKYINNESIVVEGNCNAVI